MSDPKIIKRYANRKLYDTERSCYVTLEDIATMIKAGDEVRVVDNKSGEDLTTVTFAQILFEAEKKTSFMPMSLLRDLIKNGGEEISAFAREQADRVQARANEFKESADKLRKETAERLHTFEERVGGMMGRGDDGAKPKLLSDMLTSTQKAVEELHKAAQQRFKDVARHAHLENEFDEVTKRLSALMKRLEKMP